MINKQPLITVLIITYRRPEHLRHTVEKLLETTTYPRECLQLTICDDASPPDVQAAIKSLPADTFLLGNKNRGMGHNTNKGLLAADGDFILHLQDDWQCDGPGDFLEVCLELFDERPDVYFVRLRSAHEGPHEVHVMRSGRVAHIYEGGSIAADGGYVYTDNPHLKRRAFHERLGLYIEGKSMPRTELEFCRRFDKQQECKIAWIEGYSVFVHTGADCSFNPLQRRAHWIALAERFVMTRYAIRVARRAKAVIARAGVHRRTHAVNR
jgi:glycosyltransferase involved in cell wall biosynthesis